MMWKYLFLGAWVLFFCLLAFGCASVVESACPPVKRSSTMVRVFRASHPCPGTGVLQRSCPGYVVDHIVPLCALGPAGDVMANMQWQAVAEAKAKDRQERAYCRAHPRVCGMGK